MLGTQAFSQTCVERCLPQQFPPLSFDGSSPYGSGFGSELVLILLWVSGGGGRLRADGR